MPDKVIEKRELLGHVGVDSGQLMVMDPCYVRSSWDQEGTKWRVKFWGRDEVAVSDEFGFSPIYCKDEDESKELARRITEYARNSDLAVMV